MLLRSVLLCIVSLISFGLTVEAGPPNIVFFLVDDLGYADCGFNGGQDIRTPNIDRLAREGAILESHYVQPVCSPTRAALLTGRYATKTGVYTIVRPKATWGLPLNERTLANALKEAGYETAISGKWHLGEHEAAYRPTARGFDHQYGHYFGMIDYFTHIRQPWHDWFRNDHEVKEEGYSTHLIAKEACARIENKEHDKPLFLYVPFNGVHSPLQVPENYLKAYPELEGNRLKMAGMLSAVDEAIGQIVGAIEQAGLREQTMFVFSADNGGPTQYSNLNGPLRSGKGTLYEGGIRGCAFANWPGQIKAAQRIAEPVHVIDWYPTFVRLAGGKLEQSLPMDGKDLWPLLTQSAKSPHDAILSVQTPTQAALRMGDWKLIAFDRDETAKARKGKANQAATKSENQIAKTYELYNLAMDIGESQNLATKEPEQLQKMQSKLTELLREAVSPGHVGNEPSTGE
jgi:arylsulfatase A-like enzyme